MHRIFIASCIMITLLITVSCTAAPSSSSSSSGSSGTVSDSLYGGYFSASTPQACYWSNSVFIPLAASGESSGACKAYQSGGNIYISGNFYTNSYICACCWINGTLVMLETNVFSRSYDIGYLNSVGYNCGYSDSYACFWSNDVLIYLTNDLNTYYSTAYDMAVSGGKVYMAGGSDDGNYYRACYWAGSTMTVVGPVSSNSQVFEMAVSGGNVYMAGYFIGVGRQACYWINGTMTVIGGAGSNSEAHAVAISGSDVITAGYAYNGTNYRACIWTNTNMVFIGPDGTNSYIKPYQIAL
jgi:hypothetical protein